MNIPIKIFLIVIFCAILGSFGQIFFKIASKSFSFNIKDILLNFPLIIGIFLYGSSAILFIYALKYSNLSVIYPIIATSYIFVLILSYIFFNESLTYSKISGVLIIILGIWLITR